MQTKHTCNMSFGRKTIGCPRCDELIAGAEPVKWAWAESKKRNDKSPKTPHKCTDRCGTVCTFGEW